MRKKSFNKYSFQSKKEKPKKKHILIEIVIYMVEIAIVIGLAYALIQYGVMKTTMVGDSMAQTLYNEDEVLIVHYHHEVHSLPQLL